MEIVSRQNREAFIQPTSTNHPEADYYDSNVIHYSRGLKQQKASMTLYEAILQDNFKGY